MLKPFFQKKPSILRLMLISVISLALFAIIAAFSGYVLTHLIQTTVNHLTDNTNPKLITATKINIKINSVRLRVPKIKAAKSAEELEVLQSRIISSISRALKYADDYPDFIELVSLVNQKDIVQESINYQAELLNKQNQFDLMLEYGLNLIRDVNILIDIRLVDLEYETILDKEKLVKGTLSSSDFHSFFLGIENTNNLKNIRAGLEKILNYLIKLDLSNSLFEVASVKNNFLVQLRAVSKMLPQAHQDSREILVEPLKEIYNLTSNLEENIFSIKESSVRLYEQSELSRDGFEKIILKVRSKIDLKIKKLQVKNQAAIFRVKKIISMTAILFGAMFLGLVLISIFLIRSITLGKIVNPLRQVTLDILQVSKGHKSTNLDTKGLRELIEIKQALGVFEANAKQLRNKKQEVLEKNKLLAKNNDKLNTFIRVMSHDLKSPIRGVLLLCELMREGVDNDDKKSVLWNIDRTEQRLNRLDQLLDDLILYNKVDLYLGSMERVDLQSLVRSEFEILDKSDYFSLEVLMLPQIETLKTPLALVVRNLMDNAMKHHDSDTGKIKVELLEDTVDFLHLVVSDDGLGIDPAYQERIFGAFETLRPKDEVEGSGMGLALIRKIIVELGGKVWVESNPPLERGSRFHVLWPKEINIVALDILEA